MTTDRAREALGDVLTLLDGLMRDAVRPPEALARAADLRRANPGLIVDLVWEEAAYPATIQYDALLPVPGGDTVSLSVCKASETPWPLRGVRLASDQDLVRVNGAVLKVREAMESIDFLWGDARLVGSLIDGFLLDAAVKRLALEPLAEHTQAALDRFRSARGLLSARRMHAWMDANDMTAERLAQMVNGQARVLALRDRVAADAGEEAYWDAHPGAFDIAHTARMRVRSLDHAEMIATVIRRGRNFHDVMEEEFAARRLVAMPNGALEVLRRRELPPAHAEVIFAVGAGDLVGPMRADPDGEGEGPFDVLRVIRLETARREDATTRDAVRAALLEVWLARERARARIEWCWGPAH